MAKIHTEIIIEAPLDRVSELLADTDLYPQWHTLFSKVTGRMETGARIEVAVTLPEIKPFSVSATIQEYTSGRHLRWRYGYRLPGFFSWSYSYHLEAINSEQVKFIQESIYSGLLAPLYYLGMKSALHQGMQELNKAVQRWGERRGISCLKC